MTKTFRLRATYLQNELHELKVTFAQWSALRKHYQPKVTLAEIIRSNWPAMDATLRAFTCSGYDSVWHDGERLANITHVEGGDILPFTATSDGPRFTHEIQPAGRAIRAL